MKESWRPPITVILCGVLLAVSLLSFLPASAGAGLHYLEYVALASVAVGIPPILRKAWVSLRNRALDINVLMTVAVAGACGLQDFVEAAGIVFLFGIAEWLEDRCIGQARNTIGAVLSLQPEEAVLAETGKAVPVEEVPVGALVLVRPGEKVSLDGEVVAGSSALDCSMLTGETKPVVKSVGDAVMAGTINVGLAPLQVRLGRAVA